MTRWSACAAHGHSELGHAHRAPTPRWDQEIVYEQVGRDRSGFAAVSASVNKQDLTVVKQALVDYGYVN